MSQSGCNTRELRPPKGVRITVLRQPTRLDGSTGLRKRKRREDSSAYRDDRRTTGIGKVNLTNHDGSPFEIFVQRAINIPSIWEIIASNLSVNDVANCLKVSKNLGMAIGQCLATNTRLKCQMDIAATVSAIARQNIQSQVQIQFRCNANDSDKLLPFHIQVIDNTWYYKNSCTDSQAHILRLGKNLQKMNYHKSELNGKLGIVDELIVLPTQDTRRVFMKSNYLAHGCLVNLGTRTTNVVSVAQNPMPSQNQRDWNDEIINEEEKSDRPFCVRYRLYMHNQNNNNTIWLTLLNEKGEIRENVILYNLKLEYTPDVKHSASKQEKFAIVLPHLIAVHSIITGDVLWERHIDKEGKVDELSPFITESVTGYIQEVGCIHDDADNQLFVQIYNTSTGEFITSIELPLYHKCSIDSGMLASGPYLIYCHVNTFHVLRIQGLEAQTYEFGFPFEYLEKTCGTTNKKLVRNYVWDLFGFLGKSNILIGTVQYNERRLPFCLDLDVYFKAKEKSYEAFSIPLASYVAANPTNKFSWSPIYKTDKSSKFLDLVGIMNQTKSINMLTLDNFFLVTEMQLP